MTTVLSVMSGIATAGFAVVVARSLSARRLPRRVSPCAAAMQRIEGSGYLERKNMRRSTWSYAGGIRALPDLALAPML